MGQITFGLMYGTRDADIDDLEDFLAEFEESEPEYDESYEVLGYLIAAGASGRRGLPDLEGPIDPANVDADERYVDAIKTARSEFAKFEAFALSKGVKLDNPRLYLVEIEVA